MSKSSHAFSVNLGAIDKQQLTRSKNRLRI